MAFGVIACNAINVIIARLVGSAIAWKMSRLILVKFFCEANRLQIYAQPFGFTNFFSKIFSGKKDYEFGLFGCRCVISRLVWAGRLIFLLAHSKALLHHH